MWVQWVSVGGLCLYVKCRWVKWEDKVCGCSG